MSLALPSSTGSASKRNCCHHKWPCSRIQSNDHPKPLEQDDISMASALYGALTQDAQTGKGGLTGGEAFPERTSMYISSSF